MLDIRVIAPAVTSYVLAYIFTQGRGRLDIFRQYWKTKAVVTLSSKLDNGRGEIVTVELGWVFGVCTV